jgi:predicted nucleic acid-binding protein
VTAIGTAAVVDGAPLITHNTKHLSKVPGLELVGY